MNQERASGAREQPRPPKGFRRQRRCEGEENSKSQRRSSSLLLLGLFGKWGFKSCFLVFCTPLYETKWDGFWFVHVLGIVCGFYLLDGLSKVYSLLTFSSIIIFISSHFFSPGCMQIILRILFGENLGFSNKKVVTLKFWFNQAFKN